MIQDLIPGYTCFQSVTGRLQRLVNCVKCLFLLQLMSSWWLKKSVFSDDKLKPHTNKRHDSALRSKLEQHADAHPTHLSRDTQYMHFTAAMV